MHQNFNGKGYMHISNELKKALYVYSTYPNLFFHVPIRSGHNSIEIALQPVPSMPKNLWPTPNFLFFLSFFPKLNNVACDYIWIKERYRHAFTTHRKIERQHWTINYKKRIITINYKEYKFRKKVVKETCRNNSV